MAINYGFGVALHKIGQYDNDTLRDFRNNPEIWKWCRQNDLISDQDQATWCKSQASDKSIKMYGIWHPTAIDMAFGQAGSLFGACGLTSIDMVNRRAEFSCYIGNEYQKKGFAKAALKTLFSYGFKELNLHQIWGETFHGNHALDLFKKLGMKEDGLRRDFYFKGGKYLDCHLVSMLDHEFFEIEKSWTSS